MIQWTNKWMKGKNGVESPRTNTPRVVALLRVSLIMDTRRSISYLEVPCTSWPQSRWVPGESQLCNIWAINGRAPAFCQGDKLFVAALNDHGLKASGRPFSPAASSCLPNPLKAPLPFQGQGQAGLKSTPGASFPRNQGSVIHGSRTQPGYLNLAKGLSTSL